MIDMLGYEFIRTALLGTTAIGIVCAYLGVYVVLRRIVFVGATMAQVSSAGIALGILTGWSPNAWSVGLTFLAVLFFAHPSFGKRWPQDATLGVLFTVSGAAAVLLVAHTARGNEEVVHLVQGNLLAMTAAEARWLAGAFAAILAIHLVFFKEFLYLSFDSTMASTQGYRAGRWNLAFYLLLGIGIALAIKAIGILLMFAFLVIPASLGLVSTRRLGFAIGVAMVSAAVAVFVGIWLSFRYDFPSAPMIIAVQGGLLVFGAAWHALHEHRLS
ncbi:MAG TPA: metal ABC transporter permease [Gemmatimonadota bacterium]|nr:metal ABC transporter permease [Gemmatimonadota bacterium]